MTSRKWIKKTVGVAAGGLFILGFLESCDNRLVGLTNFIDPCATFLANCQPGDFQANRSDLGDFCLDPTCTVPGQCDNGPLLGTIRDICP